MKAVIDADSLAYEFGNPTGEDGETLPFSFAVRRLESKLSQILENTGAQTHELHLTSESNGFRYAIATIQPYKGHRSGDKPKYWKELREYMVKTYNASVANVLEADDTAAISYLEEPDDRVLCSLDKDLDNIPGNHYNWRTKECYVVTEVDAKRHFWKQMLTGDSADNILGLYQVGDKSALVKKVNQAEEEIEMAKIVIDQYKKRFGNYWKFFLLETGSLLWILHDNKSAFLDIFNSIIEKLDSSKKKKDYNGLTVVEKTKENERR